MNERKLDPIDKILKRAGSTLQSLPSSRKYNSRENPARKIPEAELSENERLHSAGLMRVNHAGEIAAQGLYQGHSIFVRNPDTEKQILQAAQEELDHMNWCKQRLEELDAKPSILSPIWYSGAFLMGALSSLFGDKWSLGFIEETEKQVSSHLMNHLQKISENDSKSRAIIKKMREEEEEHGNNAKNAGARNLPIAIRKLMQLTSKVMTKTAYWI